MRWRRTGIVSTMALAALGTSSLGWPSPTEAVENLSSEELAEAVLDPDEGVRDRASEELRRRGPAGHAALMRVHAAAIERLRTTGVADQNSDPLRRAIDRVSAQRDGHASGLYWHTDLGRAQEEARRTGRPILSLRLLGRLDEELSCANSRFFRVLLYSDPAVADRLSRQFVLHWSSERPAPRITIDMGDGRQIVRTITGNSAHYVLDAEGRPLEVLIGLYTPRAFLAALDEAEGMYTACHAAQTQDARRGCLARAHEEASRAFGQRWNAAYQRDATMGTLTDAIAAMNALLPAGDAGIDAPPAPTAMRLTIAKNDIEGRMLDLIEPNPAPPGPREPHFDRAGSLLYGEEPVSDRTVALIRLKNGAENPSGRAGEMMRSALADSARNEVLFHLRVHSLFTRSGQPTSSFEELNAHVYRALMLTPATDPWLGLAPDERWDVIER